MHRFFIFLFFQVSLPFCINSQSFIDIPGPLGATRCFLKAPNGIIYLGTNSRGVYRSADEGKTWSAVGGNTIMTGRVNALVFDRNGQILAATEQAGIKRWDGTSWKNLNTGLFSACGIIIPIRALAVDSSGTVFAGAHSFSCFPQGDVYRLDDTVWTSIGAGLANFNLNTLAVHPLSNVLYAGTDGGVFKYENAAWVSFNNGFPGPGARALRFLPGGTLLAGADGGPATCANGANTWMTPAAGWSEGSVSAITYADPGGQHLLLGTGYSLEQRGSVYGKLFQSGDFGAGWQEVTGNVETTGINDLVFVGSGSAVAAGWGILRSEDQGNTWAPSNTGFNGKTFNSQGRVAVAADNHTLLYGSDDGLFKSTDNGLHWRLASKGLERHIVTLLKADHFGNVYCGVMRYEPGVGYGDGNLYLSGDNGDTWEEVQISEDWRYLEISELPNGDLICAHGFGAQPPSATITGSSLALSTDHGHHWADLNVQSGMAFCCTADAAGHLFVAGESQTLYRSTDYGQSFELITVAGQQGNVGALETSPDGSIFMGAGGQRTLYFSLDDGNSFTPFSSSVLPDYRGVSDITFDKNGVAYCTTTGVGMPSLFTIQPPFTSDAVLNPVSGLSGSLFKMCWDFCGYLYIYRAGSVLRSADPLRDPESSCISAVKEHFDPSEICQLEPNPVTDIVNLHFRTDKPKILRLFHSDGRLVETVSIETLEAKMDLAPYPSGYYFLMVQEADGKVGSFKLVRL